MALVLSWRSRDENTLAGRNRKNRKACSRRSPFKKSYPTLRGPKLPDQQITGATYFEGSPNDPSVLRKAISGCDTIVSVLNISRTSDFPWARLRTPKNFLSNVMDKLISVAHENNIERIVICSAWGVSDTRAHIPGWFRWFIDNSNIGIAYADHERQEAMLKQTNLKWTIVRPAGLINSRTRQQIIESYDNHPKPRLTISRLSVAQYMVGSLLDDTLIRKSPVISGRPQR